MILINKFILESSVLAGAFATNITAFSNTSTSIVLLGLQQISDCKLVVKHLNHSLLLCTHYSKVGLLNLYFTYIL